MRDLAEAASRAETPAGAEPALFLRACRGEPVERTPLWIMRQAGRYLPEYRALRERHDFVACCRTPELACTITLQPVRRLGVDAAILFSDILVPLPGMGVDVAFDPGPVISQPVRTCADVRALRTPDPSEATPFVLETVRLLRRELPPQVPLIGFAGAPFTLAAYLIEGGASKSFSRLKGLLYGDPETAHELLAKCADTVGACLAAQVHAGAQAAMLFDTWAGILAPEDVESFALAYARRVFERVARAGADLPGEPPPRIYYAGEAAGWLERAATVGAEVIGVDWRLGLDAARARLGPALTLQGNLDPAVLLGPRERIRQRTAAVLTAAGRAGGHVFNLGHGILPETPPENARYLVDVVRELSERRAP